MIRREFIALAGGAAIGWPLAARAQQKPMPVIGYLSSSSSILGAPSMAAFRLGLGETGWVEGQMWRSNTAGRRAIMTGTPHLPLTSSAVRST
jgi:hypothetical protein